MKKRRSRRDIKLSFDLNRIWKPMLKSEKEQEKEQEMEPKRKRKRRHR